jgi:hypothetical protein
LFFIDPDGIHSDQHPMQSSTCSAIVLSCIHALR